MRGPATLAPELGWPPRFRSATLALPSLDDHASRLARAVHEGTPGFVADLVGDLERACRMALDLTYRYALGDPGVDGEIGGKADAELASVARAFVELGLGLDVMTRIIRFAHQEAVAGAPGETDTEGRAGAVQDVARRSAQTWARVEAMIHALATVYTAAQRERADSGLTAKITALEAVLEGGNYDRRPVERDLGYGLDGAHVAFVVWDTGGATDRGAMRAAAERYAEHRGGRDLLCVPLGTSALRCWTHADGAAPNGAYDLAIPSAFIAAGEGHDESDGFRRSMDEAVKTRRLMTIAGRQFGPVARFADVSLLVLLSSDLPAAERFVQLRLGPLVAPDRNTRRLLETLEAFFEEGCSYTRSAARLDTHVKTIAYRIRRAETLLGHPVDQRMLDTQAALALSRWLRMRDGDGEAGTAEEEWPSDGAEDENFHP